MTKVTKFLCIAVFGVLFSVATKAQLVKLPKVLAFGNFTYAIPQGNFSNIYSNGMGFEAGAGLGLGKTLLYASTGYLTYKAENGNPSGDWKVVPIKFGVRRYLLFGLFLNGALGIANQSFSGGTGGSSSSSLLYEVGAGIKVLGLVEIGAAYTGYNATINNANANAILLKAGLAIKL
jgi:hypothetical protein